MNAKKRNPWNLPEFTKLKHKLYGWTVTYEYDLCYQEWYLWNGQSLLVLDDWKLEDFCIL